jgi:hypothetical protein
MFQRSEPSIRIAANEQRQKLAKDANASGRAPKASLRKSSFEQYHRNWHPPGDNIARQNKG